MKLSLLYEADRWTDTLPGMYGTVPYMSPEHLKQQWNKPIPTKKESDRLNRRPPQEPNYRVPVGPEDRIIFIMKRFPGKWITVIQILKLADKLAQKANKLGYEHPRPKHEEIKNAISNLEKRGVIEQYPMSHGSMDWRPRWRLAGSSSD